jgi:hypothetical protein
MSENKSDVGKGVEAYALVNGTLSRAVGAVGAIMMSAPPGEVFMPFKGLGGKFKPYESTAYSIQKMSNGADPGEAKQVNCVAICIDYSEEGDNKWKPVNPAWAISANALFFDHLASGLLELIHGACDARCREELLKVKSKAVAVDSVNTFLAMHAEFDPQRGR